MGSFFAGLKIVRAAAFFGKAVQSQSRETQGNHQGGILGSKLLYPGLILVSTIGLAFKGVSHHIRSRRELKAQKEHDAAMIEKTKIAHGVYDKDNQPSNTDGEIINPTDNPAKPMPNEPMQQMPSDNNGNQFYMPAQQEQSSKLYDKNPEVRAQARFELDDRIGAKRFDLEQYLIVMKFNPDSNEHYALINTAGSEPDFYITGSGIYDKDHNPYYKMGFENDKTLYLDQMLELINEHEYQDMLTIFEAFDY